MLDNIKENSIIVCNYLEKQKILKHYFDNKKLVNFKILNINEFITNMTFSYDTKTIYYIMHKYNVNYDIALIYLNNLKYINQEYNDSKLEFLFKLKEELTEEKLIKENRLFKQYISDKQIIFYNINYDLKYINKIGEGYLISFIENEIKEEYAKKIIHFKTIQDEIIFVGNSIINLLKENIPASKIKLVNVTSEYLYSIKYIFNLLNIPISINNSTLYGTVVAKDFFDNLSENISDTISILQEKYDSELISDIIDICNSYSWCNNFLDIKDMLIYEFRNKVIKDKKTINNIEFIDVLDMDEESDNYYYLLGFNNENIPRTYKDTDYISDKLSKIINKETTTERFVREKNLTLDKIKKVKNLVITYKDKTYFNTYLISSLNDDLKYEIIEKKSDNITYSSILSSLELGQKLDTYFKYGNMDENLKLLYNSLPNNYKKYDNNFKEIDTNDLYEFLDRKLLLSYSAIDNYYKCGFKYYINNILKLDEFESNFSAYLGSLMHYVLSKYSNQDFNLEKEFKEFLDTNEYELTSKEEFFLGKTKEYLKFIIETINKQKKLTNFNKELYEKAIYIDKSSKIKIKITFMGVIDKIMYLEKDNKEYVSIIDYKTGFISTKLDRINIGFDLQLPIYAYLIKNSKMFKNPIISGLYYQKLLDMDIKTGTKEEYEKELEKKLYLQGISTSDENILSQFDKTYENSELIKGMKTTKTGFSAYTRLFSNQELDDILLTVESKINEAIKLILDGKFPINPKSINHENVSCAFCKYKDLCFMTEDNIVTVEEGELDA